MPVFELKSYYIEGHIEAGCDEAGRGCLAGPVVAAAVILPNFFSHPLLNDSKQLSAKSRNLIRLVIEKEAIAFAVAECSHTEIDSINILNASILAMHKAISKLSITPQSLIIDGNKFLPYNNIPHKCIIKGDATYKSIAAASILAKTYRDDLMLSLHKQFPHYGWDKNKGYGTEIHLNAINKYGQCDFHRKTFKVRSNKQLRLNFD